VQAPRNTSDLDSPSQTPCTRADVQNFYLDLLIRVDFELDAEVSAPTGNFRQLLHVLSTPASSDLDICLWVERIAGYSKDVNKRGVLAQELLRDLRAVLHDTHAFYAQFPFPIAEAHA